ncbi:MAG TPA: trypsin-like peptidase domain-containing protein [bacterium]|jgi:serine protease Do|nr:trypsin-like peptidase domain-containing protein [Dictyoglomota bacterium]HHV81161.1 trypsin-like serine protease [bacterium]HOL55895.1 trypsin-like peptidase domain-containing protein [bacterium]HOP55641.1 trypsin-like peptidase domain-containing protein [bacterium]HPC77090.1 trypsin-like peptidase domain-containing protein [bacterium]
MRRIIALTAILAFLGGLILGYVGNRENSINSALAQTEFLSNEEAIYVSIAEKLGPSVVNISTVSIVQYFFQPIPAEGAGSGVIISRDGYIITNNHVVEGAKSIKVTLEDGQTLEGKLIGRDPFTDIAVIKVNMTDLPYAKFSDPSRLKVGQIAIAIGNPFGLGKTVTAGIVSALERSIQPDQGVIIESLIQTDAAINPGNSGGALVGSNGEIIGINTAIYQGAQGIGFAIPSNVAKKIAEDIIEKGYASHPWLGIKGETLNRRTALYYGLPIDYGVIIGEVVKSSPADRAGLKVGDVIVGVDNERIDSWNTLLLKILKTKNNTVTLQIMRKSSKLELKVQIDERPKQFATNGGYL